MPLAGVEALAKRLAALEGAPLVLGRRWQTETVKSARARIPVRTGATRDSIHAGRADSRSARVVASHITNFIDAGSAEHDVRAKNATALRFEAGGRTVFAKRAHVGRIAARPFKRAAAREGLERARGGDELVKLWNAAR